MLCQFICDACYRGLNCNLQSDYDLRKEFTVLRNSGKKPWLLDISNNVTKQAIKDLCIAYNEAEDVPHLRRWGCNISEQAVSISPASLRRNASPVGETPIGRFCRWQNLNNCVIKQRGART